MVDFLDLLFDIIRYDFFIAFGLYSILYVIVSLFTKRPEVEITDASACKLISWIGILYFVIWMVLLATVYNNATHDERQSMINRMFGRYWFGYWLQPILWIAITQLLRFDTIRKLKLLRLFFAVCMIISIEQYVILITSLHRDYLPSSWSMSYAPYDLITGILLKIGMWLLLSLAFLWIYRKVKLMRR